LHVFYALLLFRENGSADPCLSSVNIAIWEKPATFVPNDLVFKERSYMGQ
jgi:hypothetical protein